MSACRRRPHAVESVTGGHTRVVWTRDSDELRDVHGRGNRLSLVGFDSRNGQGESVIIPGPAPIHKPLFTPDGERVVFSVIESDSTYIVNWDGNGYRRLAEGMAVAVWRDPDSGRDWVYLGRGRRLDRDFTFSFSRIHRAPLDDIAAEEPVWTKTRMAIDNIQLSADGRRASGQFPWPETGLARFPDGGFDRTGRGCWTALAPDNSYVMWILDGAHRNLLLVDARSGERWSVNISRAPEIGGHEVYHPRWSNHPDLLVMTGPYTIAGEGNNIEGGGPQVEIHIGRFSRDRRSIEEWVRVTNNEYANFYPDLWVDPAVHPAPVSVDPVPEPAKATAADWPPVDDALVYLWRHRDATHRLETAEGDTRIGDPEPAGVARYGRHLEMDLRRGYFLERAAGNDLAAALRGTGGFTFEAWLTPEGDSDPLAVIWGLDGSDAGIAFALTAGDGQLRLRWRSPGHPGRIETADLAGWREDEAPRHLAVTLGEGQATVYRDGRRVGETILPRIDPEAWPGGTIYFGGSPEENTNWSGFLEGIAFRGRALSPEEVKIQAEAYRALAAGRADGKTATVRAELTETSRVPSPEDIAPYNRGLVVNEYRVIEVLDGLLEAEEILAAHWVIMDGRPLEAAQRKAGRIYTMRLEPYDARPELEGERLSMDTENILLDTYYDIDS